MQTIPIELPDELAALLDRVCLENGEMKQRVVHALIVRYLEDIEDAAEAARVMEQNNPTTPLADVRRELGLDH